MQSAAHIIALIHRRQITRRHNKFSCWCISSCAASRAKVGATKRAPLSLDVGALSDARRISSRRCHPAELARNGHTPLNLNSPIDAFARSSNSICALSQLSLLCRTGSVQAHETRGEICVHLHGIACCRRRRRRWRAIVCVCVCYRLGLCVLSGL